VDVNLTQRLRGVDPGPPAARGRWGAHARKMDGIPDAISRP
jgi:hypothetical protein